MKEINKEIFNDIKTIAIYGNCGSGKTALAYYFIDILKQDGRGIYFLKHPNPEIIEELGYFNLDSLEMIEKLQDCVIYLDEPQIILSIQTKKSNKIIAQVCSLARQLNITLIISSSDTRVFTKSNEAYFDLWCIKDLDYDMVKNGSKIKNILKKNALFDPAGLRLDCEEFLAECRRHPEINGKQQFPLPVYFAEEHSKPFRRKTAPKIAVETATQNAIQGATKIPPEKKIIQEKMLENCDNPRKYTHVNNCEITIQSNKEKPSQSLPVETAERLRDKLKSSVQSKEKIWEEKKGGEIKNETV